MNKELLQLLRQVEKNLEALTGLRMRSPMHKLEGCVTLRAIASVIRPINPAAAEEDIAGHIQDKLKGILAKRWVRIRESSLVYTEDYDNPINRICYRLASILEQEAGDQSVNRFRLLIPSLTVVTSPITGTSLNDPEVKLSDFVLDDTETIPIHIAESLVEAEEDGQLRHTFAVDANGRTRFLSRSEQRRLLSRSAETEEYWSAILCRFLCYPWFN